MVTITPMHLLLPFSLSSSFFCCSLFLSPTVAGLTVYAITNCNWLVKFGITCFNAIKIQMNRIQLNLKYPTNRYRVMLFMVSIFISSFSTIFCLWFVPMLSLSFFSFNVSLNRSEYVFSIYINVYYRMNYNDKYCGDELFA